jgi:hypothetical protein
VLQPGARQIVMISFGVPPKEESIQKEEWQKATKDPTVVPLSKITGPHRISVRIPLAVAMSRKVQYIACKAVLLPLSVQVVPSFPNQLQFDPIFPSQLGNPKEFRLLNNTDYPWELYANCFDSVHLAEEELLLSAFQLPDAYSLKANGSVNIEPAGVVHRVGTQT